MNTTGPLSKLCSPRLQQKVKDWADGLDAILLEAGKETIDRHSLLAEVTIVPRRTYRKIQPWNAFLAEEARGVRINKETMSPLLDKYADTSSEDKLLLCKRMANVGRGPNLMEKRWKRRKWLPRQVFKEVEVCANQLTNLGIQSIFIATSPRGEHAVWEKMSRHWLLVFILTDDIPKQFEAFLWAIPDEASDADTTNAATRPNIPRRIRNPLRQQATEKLQKAYGAALGIDKMRVQWNKVFVGPTYPRDMDYVSVETGPKMCQPGKGCLNGTLPSISLTFSEGLHNGQEYYGGIDDGRNYLGYRGGFRSVEARIVRRL